jgi:hypothetical protein
MMPMWIMAMPHRMMKMKIAPVVVSCAAWPGEAGSLATLAARRRVVRRVAAVDAIKVPRGGRLRARGAHATVGLDELHLIEAEEQVEGVVVQVSGEGGDEVEWLDALLVLLKFRGHRRVRVHTHEETRELLGAAAMVGLWAGPHHDDHITVDASGKCAARLGSLIVGALQCRRLGRRGRPQREQDEEDVHLQAMARSSMTMRADSRKLSGA